jgi:hypothetical protein
MTPEIPISHEISNPTIDIVRNLIKLRTFYANQEYRPPVKWLTKQFFALVKLPATPRLLLDSPQLWIDVNGTKFTPRNVVEKTVKRNDGKNKQQNSFDVYIATEMEAINKIWGKYPESVFRKQRHQFWNYDYVKAFFAHIELQIDTGDLENTFLLAISDMAKVDRHYKGFLKSRNSWPKPGDNREGGFIKAARRRP